MYAALFPCPYPPTDGLSIWSLVGCFSWPGHWYSFLSVYLSVFVWRGAQNRAMQLELRECGASVPLLDHGNGQWTRGRGKYHLDHKLHWWQNVSAPWFWFTKELWFTLRWMRLRVACLCVVCVQVCGGGPCEEQRGMSSVLYHCFISLRQVSHWICS